MSNNDDGFVPCEICEQHVRFTEYQQHITQCAAQRTANGQQQYIIYRDEDDNAVYRIDISPAITMFTRMQLENQRVAESSSDDDYHDPHHDDDDTYTPSPINHASIVIIPRIIPVIPEIIRDDNTYEFNTLLSDVIGKVRVGLDNPNDYLVKSQDISEDVCPICQDFIDPALYVKTLCKHAYCESCITLWFRDHTTCPICNADQREIVSLQKSESKDT